MTQKIGIVAVVGILGALAWTTFRAPIFPNVTLTSPEGESVTIDQLRAGKSRLVVALIMPTDALSKAAVGKLKAQHPALEPKATVIGFMMADPAAAAAFARDNDLPFSVYSLTPQANPIEYNEVVKTVGGFRRRFFVGTVLVLDDSRKIKEQVNGDELENLTSTLEKL